MRMTVNELIGALIKIKKLGKGHYEITLAIINCYSGFPDSCELEKLSISDGEKCLSLDAYNEDDFKNDAGYITIKNNLLKL
jgi:hypothetical protein